MCKEPKTFNGFETSCRECNECCATYKNTWVARCIAELQTHPHALCFTLTYADVRNSDGDMVKPLGAKVFRYKDVQDFWKRIRRAGEKRYGKSFVLRYVVVGELGTRYGRCHYHGVMFSNYPINVIGTFTDYTGREGVQFKKRLDWTTWGKGFVELQPADRKGISYALKYILKARMTDRRSKGTHREGKTEWLASSYLWCSKVPAIGGIWLRAKVEAMADRGQCPPSLRVGVPSGGEWYISGELQKQMCLFLRERNIKFLAETGSPLSGFKSLLASVSEPLINADTGECQQRKAWEFLTHGVLPEEQQSEAEQQRIIEAAAADFGLFRSEIVARRNASLHSTRARKCFGITSCARCEGYRTADDLVADAQVVELWREAFHRQRNPLEFDNEEFSEWITRQGLVAAGCLEQHESRYSFDHQSREHQRYCEELKQMQRAANGSGEL